MTVFLEVSGPFQRKPGLYRSDSMVRVWWGPFAMGWLWVPFQEFVETDYRWAGERKP